MKEIKTKITTFLFSIISFIGFAQGPPPPQPPPPPGLPLDSGLAILLTIGLLYGVFRILKLKRT